MQKENRLIYRETPSRQEKQKPLSTESELDSLRAQVEDREKSPEDRYQFLSQKLKEVHDELADLDRVSDEQLRSRLRRLGFIGDSLDALQVEAEKAGNTELVRKTTEDIIYINEIQRGVNAHRMSIFFESDFLSPERLKGEFGTQELSGQGFFPTAKWAEDFNKLSYEDQKYVVDGIIKKCELDADHYEKERKTNSFFATLWPEFMNFWYEFGAELERTGQQVDAIGFVNFYRNKAYPKLESALMAEVLKKYQEKSPEIPDEFASQVTKILLRFKFGQITKKEALVKIEDLQKKYRQKKDQ